MTNTPDPKLRNAFLGAMSHAACTVNIITTDGAGGRAGVTVSAMSSVSADTPKPTLLVCVHHEALAAARIIENGVFCVNVLRSDQAYISDAFAGRYKDQVADKFDIADWARMPSGAPRIIDPLVGFDCTVVSSERVGTHYVFFGEVGSIFTAERGSPLIYANRAYGTASRIDSVASIAAGKQSVDHTLSVGSLPTFGPYILPAMIHRMRERDASLSIKMVEGDQRHVAQSLRAGEIELALLYDLELPGDLDLTPLTALTPYVLLAEGHPLAAQQALTPADLAPYPMVLLDAPPTRDYFSAILQQAGVTPIIAHRSASFEMVRGLVGHGLGYSILATKPASSMTYDGRALVSRPLIAEVVPSQVVLARRRRVPLSAPAKQFIALCHEFFALSQTRAIDDPPAHSQVQHLGHIPRTEP